MLRLRRLLETAVTRHTIPNNRTMATASHIQLDAASRPAYFREGISTDSTRKASELLQENHEKYFMFFNDSGFHNHLAHQMLTMWALKATPQQLHREYDRNTDYQRPSKLAQNGLVDELHDTEKFMEHIGSMKHYNDYLEFFHREINQSGWENVVQKYVFSRDRRAEAMFVRLYASVLHPLIHLGFGIEFQQPAIIAEALAQTACTGNEVGATLLPAEKLAKERSDAGSKSIMQLLHEIYSDKNTGAVDHLAQVQVNPEDLEKKTAEMTNAVSYYTVGINLQPTRPANINFFWIHAVNCSIFFTTFLEQQWISEADKVRLLEYKIRLDLSYYISHGKPEIGLEGVRNYKPRKPSGWEAIEDRVCAANDDGHASKLIRALAHGAKICKPFEDDNAFPLKGEDWLRFGHMAIDTVELPGSNWSMF